MTQNLLAFCKKCKQIFRVIDETLEFDWLSKKEDEEATVIQDYGILISHCSDKKHFAIMIILRDYIS